MVPTGEIDLGNADDLTLATLPSQATTLERVRPMLTTDARVDLWSCSVAAGPLGRFFVNELAADTGAAVFASDHAVGTVPGADLTWEYHTGGQVSEGTDLFCIKEVAAIKGLRLGGLFVYGDKVESKSSAGAVVRNSPGGSPVTTEKEFSTGTVSVGTRVRLL